MIAPLGQQDRYRPVQPRRPPQPGGLQTGGFDTANMQFQPTPSDGGEQPFGGSEGGSPAPQQPHPPLPTGAIPLTPPPTDLPGSPPTLPIPPVAPPAPPVPPPTPTIAPETVRPVTDGPGPQINTTQVTPVGHPWTPGAGPQTPIDPGAPGFQTNLRSNVYAPGGDPRLQDAQSRTDRHAGEAIDGSQFSGMSEAATGRYRSLYGDGNVSAPGMNTDSRYRSVDPNVRAGASVNPDESARTSHYGDLQDSALEGLDNGQTRYDAAKNRLLNLESEIGDKRKLGTQDIGRDAARLGRLGSGMVTTDLGNLESRLNQQRENSLRELAASTTEGDINDRFRRVDATAGLRGQESGIDTGKRGERRTERGYTTALDENNYERNANERNLEGALDERNIGRRTNERDTMLGLGERNADRAFNRTGAAVDAGNREAQTSLSDRYNRLNESNALEDRIFNQGQSNRSEMRTERGNQNAQAQTSLDNRIRERGLQNSEMEQRTSRAVALMQASGNSLTLDQALAMLGGR